MSSLSYSDQQEIIRLCECHLATHLFDPDYHPNVNIGPWFVKYGDNGTLEPIYKTQEYLFSMAAGDLSAPRIPQVVAYFCPQQQWAYLVTERIDTTTPADTAPEAVAKALQWLRSLPIPPGLILGSVGGGCARHTVFGDFEAPLPFSSVKALQNYMNRVCHCSCTLVNCRPLIISGTRQSPAFIPKAGRRRFISLTTRLSSLTRTWTVAISLSIKTRGSACSAFEISEYCQSLSPAIR